MDNIRATFKHLPKLYLKEVQLKLDPQCSICYADYKYGEKARLLTCGHYYHTDCIMEWLKKQPTCPYCSSKFEINCDQLRTTMKRRKTLIKDTVERWRRELTEKKLSDLSLLDLRFLLFDKYNIQITGAIREDEIATILQGRNQEEVKEKQGKNENNDSKITSNKEKKPEE